MEADAWTEGDRGQWWDVWRWKFQAGLQVALMKFKEYHWRSCVRSPREPSVDKGVPFKDLMCRNAKGFLMFEFSDRVAVITGGLAASG
ncbi:MAG: hypothetical protein CM15mP49_33200 [Actinomycetota bacterium]|nr:MAG: hypothetical protein CM15mP49_33200 [Actinomycetota bacterium]